MWSRTPASSEPCSSTSSQQVSTPTPFNVSRRLTTCCSSGSADDCCDAESVGVSTQDFGEPVHVDGSAVLRPVVPLIIADAMLAVLGVVDSGSPVSVANADLFAPLGIDVDRDEPAYGIPLSVGSEL